VLLHGKSLLTGDKLAHNNLNVLRLFIHGKVKPFNNKSIPDEDDLIIDFDVSHAEGYTNSFGKKWFGNYHGYTSK